MRKENYPGIACPNCGSGLVARYLWGEPEFDNELERELKSGKIVLGGCCITGEDPEWRCNVCGCDFGSDPSVYARWLSARFKKLKGVVYGAAVGDALGVPYEFKQRGTFECTDMTEGGSHGMPKGTFSDDTSMLIATQDSIRERLGIDTQDMLAKFRLWLYDGQYTADGRVFDVGNATSKALNKGRGRDGEFDNGNGSLMRIAPLAFTNATDDEIRAVSAITHAHEISKEACVIFVRMLRDVLDNEWLPFAIEKNVPDDPRFDFMHELEDMPRDKVKSSGYVLDTLGAALWCALHTDSYRECVLAAVNLGDDTDTTACVAGALAGAIYGIDDIPKEWISDLRGKKVIDECLDNTLRSSEWIDILSDKDDGVPTEHSIKRVRKYENAETRKTRLQPVDIIQKNLL